MILPKTNLSIMDVRNCTGNPSLDLGTLCSKGQYINKWSKYKPVRYNFTTSRPSNWWKASDGNCGPDVRGYTTITQLVTDLRNDVTFWGYLPPTGGSAQPYRLGDFAGYNSQAQQPVYCNELPNIVYKDASATIGMALDMNGVDTSSNLQLTDIQGKYPLSSYYPAVVVVRADQNVGNLITASQTFAQGQGVGVEVPTSQLSAGYDYDFICCFSSIKQTSYGTNSTAANFVPAPTDNVLPRVSIKTGGLSVFVTGTWASNKSTYRIDATNRVSTAGATKTNVTLQIVYLDFKESGDSQEYGETTIKLADIVVPYNQTKTVTNVVANSLPEYKTRGGKLILTYTYNNIVNTIVGQFEDEA